MQVDTSPSDDSRSDDSSSSSSESESDDDDDEARLVVVELVVFHDGQTDLPSAADYMKRQMHRGMCHIPVGSGSLMPNPGSVQTEHHFAHQPPSNVIYEHGMSGFHLRGLF